MSFLGGGGDASCSTGSNPLSQFQKHVQDDKSMQRDRLMGRGGAGSEAFRSMARPGVRANEMMDEFMQSQQPQHAPGQPLGMDALRREFEQLRTGTPQQRAGSPAAWAAEFDPTDARMEAAFHNQAAAAKAGGFDPAEFQQYASLRAAGQSPMAANSAAMGFQRPMGFNGMGGFGSGMYGGGMGGMYGGGMGMMGNRSFGLGSPAGAGEQQAVAGKGKERMVELDDKDWEAQFAALDAQQAAAGDAEAEAAMERELDQIDRSVDIPGGPETAAFEQVWRQILTTERRDIAADEFDLRRARDEWDGFDEAGLVGSHLRDPEMGMYMFEDENPFKELATDPFAEGVQIMDSGGNLSLAALAFEAAVQRDPQHVDAWARLGAAQAQNEKEAAAIRALEQAIKLDPTNLEALMSLAVSYTNEGYDTTAYRTLERWLSTKYPSVAPPDQLSSPGEFGFTERAQLHDRVTELFIKAAQLSPDPSTMDPDVQVGLGVLFYGAEEFDKAVDCFSAALASNEAGSTNSDAANQRPLLWNRLGATLANSQRSEEAIGAYEKALELNPNFVRARYNLGVSCINIGCYAEAAQHLLGALAMHKVVEKESRAKAREMLGADGKIDGAAAEAELERIIRQNQSTNLYDTLRRVFGQMDRRDLQEKVVPGVDPDVFRGEFDF